MLGYDCHLSISMPSALAWSPIPCLSPSFVSSLKARWHSGTLAPTPGLLGHPVRRFRVALKETDGSPKFPGYPSELMPCSSTPVVASILALSHEDLLPSAPLTASAFPRCVTFRGSITRPVFLLPLASDFRYRIYPQGSLLPCWLDFRQVGLSPTG
jgi:hypothetical protein